MFFCFKATATTEIYTYGHTLALHDARPISYRHRAADRAQAEVLVRSGATCIAYETVTAPRGGLPLLKPMSEVAGRMSIQVGAHYLEKEQGGRGILKIGSASCRERVCQYV